jgi:hypothetical protein
MRPLLAIAIFAAGMLALGSHADADSARKYKRSAKQQYTQQQKADWVCEERARHADPTGQYATYPCWAREAFSRGRNNINVR